MSEVRALIEQLVDAGVDPITAAEVVTRAAIAGAKDASQPVRSKAAERQARYRERHKASQSVTKHNDVTEVTECDAGEQKENTPHTPQKKNIYNPPIIPPGFVRFWDAFADKRCKDAALKVWKSRKLESIADEVVAGAERYAATRGPDRQFWKMPQGWLNAGRWADEPDQPASKPIPPERQTVFVEAGTPEWAAWRAHDETIKPIQSQHGYGRWLPSKLPPKILSEVA